MKLIATLSACLFVFGTSYGQNAPSAKKTGHKAAANDNKTMISGSLRDMRNKPIKGIKAFVYKPDSTIVASGFTDGTGHFETNNLMPGTYFVKLIYPTDKVVLVYGLEVKKSLELNYKANPPAEDTMLAYDLIMPKPEPKKTTKK